MKKFLSVLLAVLIAMSTIAMASFNAAEETKSTEEDKVVYFDVASLGMDLGDDINVFCNIQPIVDEFDGLGYKHPDYSGKGTECTYNPETGIATYNISKAIEEGYDLFEHIDENNKFWLMFEIEEADGNSHYEMEVDGLTESVCMRNYYVIFNSNCFGDTLYCPDPTDVYISSSFGAVEESGFICKFKNSGVGSPKLIKFLNGHPTVYGESLVYGMTDESLLANYMINYVGDKGILNFVYTEDLLSELNVKAEDVETLFLEKLEDEYQNGYIDKEDYVYACINGPALLEAVGNYTLGDVDENGKVNILDVTATQKYLADIEEYSTTQEYIADVNANGKIDIIDATQTQKIIANMD